MIHAARDEDGPFGFRAFCIVGDTLLMTLATKILWV